MRRRRPLRWRLGDALDEWFHRRGFGMSNGDPVGWWRLAVPARWLCNRRELSYGVPLNQIRNRGRSITTKRNQP